MGRVEGKVALITGGARGQGRAHALRLAGEGAKIIVTDVCEGHPDWMPYPMSTQADLDETQRLVEQLDQPCIAVKADARDPEAMQAVVDRAVSDFGGIDIAAINHGISPENGWEHTSLREWQDVIDTNLSGVWYSTQPVIKPMIERGGGSIVMTSSTAGVMALHGYTSYIAAKHGVIGLMRTLSADLGQFSIRVNAICPSQVLSGMVDNEWSYKLWSGGKSTKREDAEFAAKSLVLLPNAFMEPEAIADAVLFLASDEAKYITGVALPVDQGSVNQPPGIPLIGTQLIAELQAEVERKSS